MLINSSVSSTSQSNLLSSTCTFQYSLQNKRDGYAFTIAYDLFRANTGLWEANLPSKFSKDTLDLSVPDQCAHLCKSVPFCGAFNVFSYKLYVSGNA